MVFQNYALYPYLTVAANIGFPLRMARVPKAERDARVREVGRACSSSRRCSSASRAQLSGGQRQRVAMGRAIIRQPQVFLMDEPLSNLDAKLRVQMRADIAELQTRLGVTTVYVTHDQAEAMTLGHRVAVLRDAQLQQCDTPARAVRPPGQHVRRRLRRLAGDEPLPRRRSAPTARRRSAGCRWSCPACARTARSRGDRRACGPRRWSSPAKGSTRARRGDRGARLGRLRLLQRRAARRRDAARRARADARRAPGAGERVRLRPSAEHAPHVFDAGDAASGIGT